MATRAGCPAGNACTRSDDPRPVPKARCRGSSPRLLANREVDALIELVAPATNERHMGTPSASASMAYLVDGVAVAPSRVGSPCDDSQAIGKGKAQTVSER